MFGEENNPIAVETLEAYLDFKNYFYDLFNLFLRTFVNSKLQDSEKLRSELVKEHLLQEQIQTHSSTTDAIIEMKKDKDGISRVRLSAGNLFGLVIKNSDSRMLRELLRNARNLNEDIYNILLEKGKDFYDYGYSSQPFFNRNSQLTESLKGHYRFETNKTIYGNLNDFIRRWLILAANNLHAGDEGKQLRLYFEVKPSTIFEALVVSLRESFISKIREENKEYKRLYMQSTLRRQHDLLEDLRSELKDAQNLTSTFYLDEISQFILTIITRKHPFPHSILEEVVKYMSNYKPPSPFAADFYEYRLYVNDQAPDKRYIPCSFVYEKVRKCFERDNSPWTTYGKNAGGLKTWAQSVEQIGHSLKLTDHVNGFSGWIGSHYEKLMSLFEDYDTATDEDSDIEWLRELLEKSRELLEKSRRAKNRDALNRSKHFSEFTIDKILVLETDVIGANIIHVSYLYKKYKEFGRWLVTQYPTLAVQPYSDEVKFDLRVSAVKEDLRVTRRDMLYTGENILHMTILSRDIKETRWLLDFYRSYQHTDGLTTLLMTAAVGNYDYNFSNSTTTTNKITTFRVVL